MVDYITKDSIIIFSPDFNNQLDIEFLSKYKQIIFSDFIFSNKLDETLFNAYANKDFKYLNYIGGIFNQKINLSSNITCTHLIFNLKFNKSVYLP